MIHHLRAALHAVGRLSRDASHPLSRAEPSATGGASARLRPFLEFLRYLVASGGALAVDVGLYQLGLHLGLAYPVAALLGFGGGAVVAYVASVAWVFETRSVRSRGIEFALFVAVGVAGLLLTEFLLWLQIAHFGLPAGISKIGAAGIVFVFNFAVRKTALFRVAASRAPASTTLLAGGLNSQ
jgi:putative flippase GtrA